MQTDALLNVEKHEMNDRAWFSKTTPHKACSHFLSGNLFIYKENIQTKLSASRLEDAFLLHNI